MTNTTNKQLHGLKRGELCIFSATGITVNEEVYRSSQPNITMGNRLMESAHRAGKTVLLVSSEILYDVNKEKPNA